MKRKRRDFPENRLAFDVGGTFTDIVRVYQGRLRILKVFTRHQDPLQALTEGLSTNVTDPPERILHGSTLATNTLLERKGARTALLTTQGFEDVLEIGRQTRPLLYDIHCTRPSPLVPRKLRFGIAERIFSDGRCVKAPDRKEIMEILKKAERQGAQAFAVCLLNSPQNPRNEQKVGALLHRRPLPFCLSHTVAPVQGEFERTAATVANACLLPRMAGYLRRMAETWPGSSVRIMQSNGGLLSSEAASNFPVQTVLSGPAAGVMGAFQIAMAAGIEKSITLDMGGTSTDVCLCNGRIPWTEEMSVGGLPLPIPMIDIMTVGSGGGSLARIDLGGALRVGPESAGSQPGPVCYARGGKRPTLTDAHVHLGRIQPDLFLGGSRHLETKGLERIFEKLGQKANLDPVSAAKGVLEVADTVMEGALRKVSVERGFDPRDFSLIAFGGAGGLHACELARRLGIPEVLIPPDPGLVSALGLLLADVVTDRSVSVLKILEKEILTSHLQEMARKIRNELTDDLALSEGISKTSIRTYPYAILRYAGQAAGLPVPLKKGLPDRFHKEHLGRYGFCRRKYPVEVVRIQIRGVCKTSLEARTLSLYRAREKQETTCGTHNPRKIRSRKTRPVYFKNRLAQTPVHDRSRLPCGSRISGPAVISEYSSTTVIPPGFQAMVDKNGNLRIRCP